MDRSPPEVLHQICRKLQFEDVASLRLMGRKYAAVGAEYLVDSVRFHASPTSIDRLQAFLQHPVFSQNVRTLTYEASLLADIKCEHTYAEHFQSPHHADERPQSPRLDCSDRETRLYERNVAKFNTETSAKYRIYRSMYGAQRQFLQDDPYLTTVASCAKLPKLEHVVLTNVGRCRHMLSERFIQQFEVSCAVPLEQDTDGTVAQLKLLLIPPGRKPLLGLKSLTINVLDPSFFVSTNLHSKVGQVFKSLKKIHISFRRNKDDRIFRRFEDDSAYDKLSKGGLRDALIAAVGLEELRLTFNDIDYQDPVVNLKHILGDDHVWPQLRILELECVFFDKEYFLSTLEHQPELRTFNLAWAVLKSGTWSDAILEMRKKLKLYDFFTGGLLEDEMNVHNVDNIDRDAFLEGDDKISLGDRLDMFVTDKDFMAGTEDEYNPFEDFLYDDLESLQVERDAIEQELYDSMEDADSMEDSSSHDGCDEGDD